MRPKIMAMRDDDGKVLDFRLQLPITLAYAVTVHKQLGMTVDKMMYVMSDAFCGCQIYTALSRVVYLENVFIGREAVQNVVLQEKNVLDFMKKQKLVDVNSVRDMQPFEESGGEVFI
jgi:ATP-dependent exoDNAse (exonuclease V) alpha subunit